MRLLVAVLVAGLALFGGCQQAQEQPPPEKMPPAAPPFAVAAKTMPAKTVASVTVLGAEVLVDSILPEGVQSVFELTVPKGIQEVQAWATDHEYQLAGYPMGVFPDDPEATPLPDVRTEVRWEVVPPSEGELESTERIEIKGLEEMMVAAGVYVGPYDDPAFGKALATLMDWPEQNGYQIVGSFMEVYHTDPEQTPPEEWKTEITIPVMKAPPPPEGEEATEE